MSNHLLCNSTSRKDRARWLWCLAPEEALYFPGCPDRDWCRPAPRGSPASCSRPISTRLSPRRSYRADTCATATDWRFPVAPICAALSPRNPRTTIPRRICEWSVRYRVSNIHEKQISRLLSTSWRACEPRYDIRGRHANRLLMGCAYN